MSLLHRRLVPALLLLLVACNNHRGPSSTLHIARGSDGSPLRCANPDAVKGDTLGPSVYSKVRITLRSKDASGNTLDVCDAVFNVPEPPPFFRAPPKATTVDIHAEAYGPGTPADPPTLKNVRRLATGSLLGVDPNASSLGNLLLYPTEVFSCAPVRLKLARAFHSATLLPDGRVLIVGGLVANATDPSVIALPMAGVTATGTAEIYNPRDQSVTDVTESSDPAGRAFHQAFLTPGASQCPPGNYAVLLVGGLSPTKVGSPMVGTSRGEQGGRLVPFDMNTIPNPLGAKAIGDEYLCLDPTDAHAIRVSVGTPGAAFQGAGQLGDRVVAAGGLDYDETMLNTIQPKKGVTSIDLASGNVLPGMTTVPRVGASVTVLDPGHALVWGGGGTADAAGDLLSSIDTGPTATAVVPTGGLITQFHTATLVAGSVLVTGGFEVTAGGVNTQPPVAGSAVRLLGVSDTSVSPMAVSFGSGFMADPTCSDANKDLRYRPAGWESAVALPRDRVLVTGGTASTMTVGGRCGDCLGDVSLLCPLDQAGIYEAARNALVRAGGKLSVPRFGHTSTILADGNVLIVGGIGADPPQPVFISDLEVYNARELLAPYDTSTGLDDDDPIIDYLGKSQADGRTLKRAPGEQAIFDGEHDPAKPCSSL